MGDSIVHHGDGTVVDHPPTVVNSHDGATGQQDIDA
jgi:hypothetical protein